MAEPSDTLVTVSSNSSLEVNSDNTVEPTEEGKNEKAYLPMLVGESTLQAVPPNLQSLIEGLNAGGGSSVDKCDLLVCVLYVLMVESGWVCRGDEHATDIATTLDFHRRRVVAASSRLPAYWRSATDNSYYFELVLGPFPARVCKLLCTSVCAQLNVNAVVDGVCSLCTNFRPSKYVTNPEAAFVPLKFRFLDELAVLFKDRIANAAKAAVLHAEDTPHASLQDLPTELLFHVLVRLPVRDFVRATSTCRRLRQCAAYFEQRLWQHFYRRDFPGAQPAPQMPWRASYLAEFQRKPYRKPIQHHYFYDLMDII